MRLSMNLGRSFRFEEIPVDDLPATVTRTAGRGHALFITIFAVVSGGFPVVALFAVGGEINWDLIWIVALFPLVSAGILVYGLHQLLWRETVTLSPDRVAVEQRGLFGSKSWEEPLSAYEGVVARTKRVSRSSRQGASSYTVYMVELHHADDKRNVTLYASRDESEWRRNWEAAARRLGLKALEDSEDGLLERAPEDLDKSVAELIEEGKVAVDYEQRLLAGRYVLTTSLAPAQASTAEVVAHYQSLANVEHRFKVMKDFLGLRPVFHWTETRVHGHIAICVLAAVIEAVIANLLSTADIHDPNLDGQTITTRRALAELNRIRIHHLTAGERHVTVTTRRNALQAAILAALDVNTHTWDQATIT